MTEKETRSQNRGLGTMAVLERLRVDAPAAYQAARIVGAWVWLEFASTPSEETRRVIGLLGFHWSRKRGAWQHPCGIYRGRSRGADPRYVYGSVAVAEAVAEAPRLP